MKRLKKMLFGSGGKSLHGYKNPKARVLIFDFDGTLANTLQVAIEIFNELAPQYGFDELTDEVIEMARGMSAHEIIKHFKVPATKIPSIAANGLKALHRRMPEVNPFDGVAEMLNKAAAANYVLGILTSNSENNVRDFLSRHDLPEFAFIRCSSQIFGKDVHLRKILKTNGWSAEQILFLGDEVRDIEACQKVGIACAAASWGYNTRAALEKVEPRWIIDKPTEFLDLLDFFKSR
ncbi:MAG: HAD-IA family hydrolase [Chthoniobacterales bacterium]